MEHVDYPHQEGTLYDCPACEDFHLFDGDVHCAVLEEAYDDQDEDYYADLEG